MLCIGTSLDGKWILMGKLQDIAARLDSLKAKADAITPFIQQHNNNGVFFHVIGSDGRTSSIERTREAAEKQLKRLRPSPDPLGLGYREAKISLNGKLRSDAKGSDKLRDQERPTVMGAYELDRKTLTPIRRAINTNRPGDYGSDPLGDGKFRMVPSGDILDYAERTRRLKK